MSIQPVEKSSDRSSATAKSLVTLAEAALADYATFLEHVMGYNDPDPVTREPRGLPPHQESWCDFLQEEGDCLLLAPACHGKTIVSSVGRAPWELARDRQCRIGIITGADDLAEGIMREIKSHFENNETLIKFYGQFKPTKADKWSKFECRVEGGLFTMRQKDVSITAGGVLSSWKGRRLDLLLGDDIVNNKNSDTIDKSRAIINWFWETADTRLEPWAKKKIVGTMESGGDFYNDLMKNPRTFKIRHDKAILDEPTKKVLWPRKWTFDALAEKRANNYVAFMKAYQNMIVGAEAAKLSQEQIDGCYDARETMHPYKLDSEFRSKFSHILTGVDPAWTKNKRSKYSVITTVGIRRPDKPGDTPIRQVLNVRRERLSYDELFAGIKTHYNNIQPSKLLVETNQLQDRIAQELIRDAIPVEKTFTTGEKDDLLMGIPMLYSLVAAGKLLLPTKTPADREMSEQFISELISWPNGEFSDILMSFYFCEKWYRQNSIQVKVIQESAITGRPTRTSRFSSRRYAL